MSVPEDITELVAPHGSVVCIGVFDGVHEGHRALLRRARERAEVEGLPLVAVTFDPHPMSVVRPGSQPTSLAALRRRVDLLHQAGADGVFVLPFDQDMAQLSADEFIDRILVRGLRVRLVVVGEDFRFGHRAAGTVQTLADAGRRLDFEVTPVALVGDDMTRWSSTHARSLITSGDVAGAAVVLGRTYGIDGTVVHGDHRGRLLGFPTANLSWTDDPTVPGDGVYAGWVVGDLGRLPAAISVGTNPQFQGTQRRVEAYVLDRDDLDLYGHRIEVEFVERIRGMQTFVDVDALVAQMRQDVEKARALLGPA